MVPTQSALKKVVCPACGLVNLEKFVTFPHCAGCGALLSAETNLPRVSFWRQPLRVPLWATAIVLCCAALGILGITTARETGQGQERQLLVYAEIERHLKVGRVTSLQLSLDTMAGSPENNLAEFKGVQLRIAHQVRDNFTVVSIEPSPDRVLVSELEDLIEFDTLQREETIRLLLRPVHTGNRRLVISVFVNDFSPFHFRRLVPIAPRSVYLPSRPPAKKMTK